MRTLAGSHRRQSIAITAAVFLALATLAPDALAGNLWKPDALEVAQLVDEGDQLLAKAVQIKTAGNETFAQGLANRARQRYERALRLSPGNVALHYRAYLCVANYYTPILVDWKSALYHAERIRQLDPLDPHDATISGELPHILGKALLAHTVAHPTKLYQRIVAEYERWFAYNDTELLQKHVASGHSNVAEIYMALGDLEQAIRHYQLGTKFTGDNAELPYYGLALAYERNGQRAFAREAMRKALVYNPSLHSLTEADIPGKDVYFVPKNDKYAYLALAYDVKGQLGEAAWCYQQFLNKATDVRNEYRAVASKRLDVLKRKGVRMRTPKDFRSPWELR